MFWDPFGCYFLHFPSKKITNVDSAVFQNPSNTCLDAFVLRKRDSNSDMDEFTACGVFSPLDDGLFFAGTTYGSVYSATVSLPEENGVFTCSLLRRVDVCGCYIILSF